MDLFATLSFVSFDAPEPEPAGTTPSPIDAIPTNSRDGGGSGGCIVA